MPSKPTSDRALDHGRTATPLFRAVARPIQAFFRLEAASGIVLLACALVALAWVNLLGPDGYRAIFESTVAIAVGDAAVRVTALQIVNDGLMTVFFFLVGMEIKRELSVGELRAVRQAVLPAVAAAGGMLVPAAVFLAFNRGGAGGAGWGIPMATDIAFCVGVLTLLRTRVPHALVMFIMALAIFDDIGGILVIALFYGGAIEPLGIVAAAAVTAILALMSARCVRSAAAYAVAGALLWYSFHWAGIHAAIAGVVLGLAIPARARRAPREVLDALARHANDLVQRPSDEELDAEAVLEVGDRLDELEAPLDRFVRHLHPWVAFGIMPLFALANSGVDLRALGASALVGRVTVGVALGLFVGKQLGIFGFTLAAVRLGLAGAPGGAPLAKLYGVSIVAGIGFTVALFIASLAYPGRSDLLSEAKLGILAASLASGLVGALVLRLTPRVGSAGRDEERPRATARRLEPGRQPAG